MMNKFGYLVVALILGCLAVEPALAGNKFEIIGGGVTGSNQAKREFVQMFLYVTGGVFLLMALLAVTSPTRKNASFLTFTLWKQSAAIFLVLSLASLGIALFAF
ncbi:MAG: hypothetical protein ABW116_16220 [Candidatus Sedimenticola sp. 20ELBAFRAG]